MRGRKCGEVSAELLEVKQAFSAWRASRVRGERIPERLWKSATKRAEKDGLNRTAKVLKLDYYALKKRLNVQLPASESSATFLELPAVPVADSSECVIEFHNGVGARMRVHLKGSEVPDILALGQCFWSAK